MIAPTATVYLTARISGRTILNMDPDSFIGDFCLITVPRLDMAKGSQINAHTTVTGRETVYIGRNTVISYHCALITGTDTPAGEWMNDANPPEWRAIKSGRIEIHEGAFVGSGSVIMPGVVIGRRSVIGAGAYIDKSIPRDTIVIPKQELLMVPRPQPVQET